MKLLHLTTDFVFKLVFSQSPQSLLDMLNSFLAKDPDPPNPLVELEILNPEMPKEWQSGKMSILDINAKDDRGRLYNIELQAFPRGSYVKRALYYWARLYASQMKEGEDYRKLKPTFSISLMDYRLIDSPHYHTIFTLMEKLHPEANLQLSQDISMHFLELAKFPKKLSEIEDPADLWLYLIKESSRLEEQEMATIVDKNPNIEPAYNSLKHMSQDEKMRMQEEHRRMELSQYNTDMNMSFEKGLAEKARDAARRMKAKGYPIEDISEITGLSVEEIEKI
jgi:predicted transposase/invertase (TIGR01784 family)